MKGFVQDIERLAVKNDDFRRVLYTAKNCQLVLMALKPQEEIGAEPVDEDNHALGAQRYLIATIDRAFITRQYRPRRNDDGEPGDVSPGSIPPAIAARRLWPDLDNPDLWVPLN